MKLGLTLGFFSALIVSFSGSAQAFNKETKLITVGTTAGDFALLVKEAIRPELEKKGYQVKTVEFTDYVTPNIALAEGSLDVNIFQHKPYLEEFSREKGLELSPIGQVPTAPLGLYPGKLKSLSEVKKSSKVAVPNDPTNLARALLILADVGWIEVKKETDPLRVSLNDIAKNNLDIKIVQLEAAQLPRSLQDVDYAVVNGNYATSSGIPITSALAREKSDAYINWAVVRTKDVKAAFVSDFVEVLKSKELEKFSRTRFPGYNFPKAWNK